MSDSSYIYECRRRFHSALLASVLRLGANGIPSNSDKDYKLSVAIASGILKKLGAEVSGVRPPAQTAGSRFEQVCASFLTEVFTKLTQLGSANWTVVREASGKLSIANFSQYEHLQELDRIVKAQPQLAAALGVEYLIRPDIVVARELVSDETINATELVVDDQYARLTSLRSSKSQKPILHASISCKWTIRSDRAQNARSEALPLIRNRKGRVPHIAVITAEPVPSRIASLALGTGDIDCLYHFALNELVESTTEAENQEAIDLLNNMIHGKRLRDISDLPFDLVA